MMKNRSKNYYREVRKKTIERKCRIINSYCSDNPPAYEISQDDMIMNGYGSYYPYWSIKYNGMLAKGKIHCSCKRCSFHGTTMQDKRIFLSMEDKLNDYYFDDSTKKLPNGALTLKSNIHKLAKGNYYPNGGIKGSKIPVDKNTNVEEFREYIIENKKNSAIPIEF